MSFFRTASRMNCTVCSRSSELLSRKTASSACRSGAVLRVRSCSSRAAISAATRFSAASSNGSPLCLRRRSARTSGEAVRKNLWRASGKLAVPLSRPSMTIRRSPAISRWTSSSQVRTSGRVAMREAPAEISCVCSSAPGHFPSISASNRPPSGAQRQASFVDARNSVIGSAVISSMECPSCFHFQASAR